MGITVSNDAPKEPSLSLETSELDSPPVDLDASGAEMRSVKTS